MEAYKKDNNQTKPLLITDSLPDISGGINVVNSVVSVAKAPSPTLGNSLLNPTKSLKFRSPLPTYSYTACMLQAVTTAMLKYATVGLLNNDQQLDGFDTSPVAACIGRYLGIDVSPDTAISEMI
uniref:Uncharacterized protein n=1 Tax=Amphimedon queenslandica TaxID=400682 RepID=A0A1X7UYQ2_AMPQE